jgi:hypothetical protein
MKPTQAKVTGTMRKIVDFHLDENLDWVAELECRHQQHVRHDPPWTHRHWVTTPQGRLAHVGQVVTELIGLAIPTTNGTKSKTG